MTLKYIEPFSAFKCFSAIEDRETWYASIPNGMTVLDHESGRMYAGPAVCMVDIHDWQTAQVCPDRVCEVIRVRQYTKESKEPGTVIIDRSLRKWADRTNQTRITIKGGFPPLIDIESEVCIADFSMSGTTYFVVQLNSVPLELRKEVYEHL